MGENSNIEWTDHTFNPWIGCTKVSPGCANCYAENLMDTRYGRVKWGNGNPRSRTSADNWKLPIKWNRDAGLCGTRYRVFCASLSDWLDDEVPIEWLADLLKLIHDTPNLDWLLLTKRLENFVKRMLHAGMEMMGYVDGQKMTTPEAFPTVTDDLIESVLGWSKRETFPENVWIGTSVENQAMSDKRIPLLLEIPAKVRFLSVEPMLEDIDLAYTCFNGSDSFGAMPGIHWVICGGESGPKKRPFDCDWARDLRDQCTRAGVAYFFKQVDKVRPIPDDLLIRQFPLTSKPASGVETAVK